MHPLPIFECSGLGVFLRYIRFLIIKLDMVSSLINELLELIPLWTLDVYLVRTNPCRKISQING